MASSEQPIRRGDDTAELRARYNQLCAALTMNAGTNAAAAERALQELQTLAQKIAFREAGRDNARRPPTSRASTASPSEGNAAPRKSNVIAFRCRVKAGARENPRLSAALSALAETEPVVPVERADERPGAAAPPPKAPQATPAAAMSEPPMVAAVARQGAEIDRLARKSEDQSRALQRLEQQLGQGEVAAALTAEVAELRSAATRQGEQLVSLATAVHRLAKLLAAHAPVERR
ncbi:MAG: hypothetical protein AB7S71_11325 [Dongiaceae bacterium]